MTAYLRAATLAALLAVAASPALAHGTTLPDVSSLPKDVIQLSGVVPGMGEHWANPAHLPLGPIYGVSNGKVIFLEFMIDQDSFKTGKSFLSSPRRPVSSCRPSTTSISTSSRRATRDTRCRTTTCTCIS